MKNEFGGRFIDIELENVAVAAARVVELTSRCSFKWGNKRRCLQNFCENHFSDRPTYRPTQKFAEEVAPAVNFPSSWELGIYVRNPHSKPCLRKNRNSLRNMISDVVYGWQLFEEFVLILSGLRTCSLNKPVMVLSWRCPKRTSGSFLFIQMLMLILMAIFICSIYCLFDFIVSKLLLWATHLSAVFLPIYIIYIIYYIYTQTFSSFFAFSGNC